jgi:hypothetical protein
MRRTCIPGIALLVFSGISLADEPKNDAISPGSDEPAMEVVLVTGEQPGPALWKVSSGGHVLWILGEVSPVPRKMKWRSKQFERRLDESQEVLLETRQVSQTCLQQRDVSTFQSRDLRDGRTLKDVVSPELYARAESFAVNFDASGKFKKLPAHAAITQLANSVIYSQKLRVFGAGVSVNEMARKADVRITSIPLPCVVFDDSIRPDPDEITVSCLEWLLAYSDDGAAGLRRLANAWSIGDIDQLRHLVPSYAIANESHRPGKCMIASYGSEQRANEFVAGKTDSWLGEAERALKENRSTIAVIPIAELFAPDGYLAGLRAKGYEILEPH